MMEYHSALFYTKKRNFFRTVVFKGIGRNLSVRRNQESAKVKCRFQQIRVVPSLCH